MRPVTSGTTWMVLAVITASVVRGRTSRWLRTFHTSPTARTSDSTRTSFPIARRTFGTFLSAASMSVPVPDEPDRRGGSQGDGGIDDETRADPAIDLQRREDLERDDRDDDPDEGAEHPRREEGAEDIQGWAVHVGAETSGSV